MRLRLRDLDRVLLGALQLVPLRLRLLLDFTNRGERFGFFLSTLREAAQRFSALELLELESEEGEWSGLSGDRAADRFRGLLGGGSLGEGLLVGFGEAALHFGGEPLARSLFLGTAFGLAAALGLALGVFGLARLVLALTPLVVFGRISG